MRSVLKGLGVVIVALLAAMCFADVRFVKLPDKRVVVFGDKQYVFLQSPSWQLQDSAQSESFTAWTQSKGIKNLDKLVANGHSMALAGELKIDDSSSILALSYVPNGKDAAIAHWPIPPEGLSANSADEFTKASKALQLDKATLLVKLSNSNGNVSEKAAWKAFAALAKKQPERFVMTPVGVLWIHRLSGAGSAITTKQGAVTAEKDTAPRKVASRSAADAGLDFLAGLGLFSVVAAGVLVGLREKKLKPSAYYAAGGVVVVLAGATCFGAPLLMPSVMGAIRIAGLSFAGVAALAGVIAVGSQFGGIGAKKTSSSVIKLNTWFEEIVDRQAEAQKGRAVIKLRGELERDLLAEVMNAYDQHNSLERQALETIRLSQELAQVSAERDTLERYRSYQEEREKFDALYAAETQRANDADKKRKDAVAAQAKAESDRDQARSETAFALSSARALREELDATQEWLDQADEFIEQTSKDLSDAL